MRDFKNLKDRGKKNMGISSFIIARLRKAKPFQSDPLDRLAEIMNTTDILKRDNLHRYYRVRSLPSGCLSYPDALFFDAKYYDILLPEELLAVGAHEYNHIIKKHGMKRLMRIFLPVLVIATLVCLFVFVNYGLINDFIIFNQSERILSSLFVGSLAFVLLLIASYYFNAKWLRQQESQSDFNAVRFTNGEALISALIKLNKLHPKKVNHFGSQFFPKTYPTIEQRIAYIRADMENIIKS